VGKGVYLGGGLACIEIGAKMAKVSQCRQIEVIELSFGLHNNVVGDQRNSAM
jgi:hypothetical protein